jgi:hypothetical protein
MAAIAVELAKPVADPHDAARRQVERWRGSCLDFYARGEKVVGQCLLALKNSANAPTGLKLPHLAGQRILALQSQLGAVGLSAKANTAVESAFAEWQLLDDARAYLAHGVVTVTLDQRGDWFAIFDMTVFRANEAKSQRWALSSCEAKRHADRLDQAWKVLSAQLGQVRKKLST